jgi:hypothetical protein
MRRQMLPPAHQNNTKVLKALNEDVLTEMKSMKPQLYKLYGITPQQQKVNENLNKMQMNQMNAVNVSNSTSTANGNRVTVRKGNVDDYVNLMRIAEKNNK